MEPDQIEFNYDEDDNRYLWGVTELTKINKNGLNNVILSAVIEVVGISTDGYETVYRRAVNFSEPDSNNYIEYSNLTLNNLVEWARIVADEELVVISLRDSIEKLRSGYSIVRSSFPWE